MKADIMIGLPGTGKSTLVKSLITDSVYIYNTDALEMAEAGLGSALKAKMNIIFDRTNLSRRGRAKILNRLEGYEVTAHMVWHPDVCKISDLKEWTYRLNHRPGKHISDEVLKQMQNSFVEPLLSEGFDKIIHYNMWGVKTRSESLN